MEKKRYRKQLDWRKSIEEQPYHETVNERIFSARPGQISRPLVAGASIYGLMMNDIEAENASVQRCPKCGHRSLRRMRPEDRPSPDDSQWRCVTCGNDCDEFSNRLS